MNHEAKMKLLGYSAEEFQAIERELQMADDSGVDLLDLANTQGGYNHGTVAGGYGSGNQGYGNITVNGNLGVGNGLPLTGTLQLASSGQNIMSISGGPNEKYIVQYVIVLNDWSCLELDEQQKITPREMIGICKFLNLTQAAMMSSGNNLQIHWSEFIEELGISRHFNPGFSDYKLYKTDAEILYIFLFDPIA